MLRTAFQRTLLLTVIAGIATVVHADPTTSSVTFGEHGDLLDGSVGAPIALTPTSCLLAGEGADDSDASADDVMILVTNLDGTPTVTALATPHLSNWSGNLVRISATRAVITGGGTDGDWSNQPSATESTDDVIHLMDNLGSTNDVTSIVVGSLTQSDAGTPTALSPKTLVVTTRGADTKANSADDTIGLVTDLGGTNTVTHLAAPFLPHQGSCRPVALSPTSFLVSSNGPDAASSTADDVVYLFTDVGGTNTRTDLATPFLANRIPGRPVRVTGTRAVVVGRGPDGIASTADDLLYLLDDLGGTNSISSVAVPNLDIFGATVPLVLSPTMVVVQSMGVDATESTVDDAFAIITDLGGANTVTYAIVGAMDEDRQCRPLALSPNSFIAVTQGADTTQGNDDDSVAIVSDVGGANTVRHVVLGGLYNGSGGVPAVIDRGSFIVNTKGPDSESDHDLVLVEGADTDTPTVTRIARIGEPSDDSTFTFTPLHLGQGRAVAVDTGADDSLGDGGDDALLVIDGLPGANDGTATATATGLATAKIALKFKESKPEKGEKIAVKATLLVDGARFFQDDVTVTVGNASQTIPAAAFVEKKGNYTYSDRKRENGWITKFSWKAKKGKLTVKGKGVATGAESTAAGNVIFAIDTFSAGFYSDSLVGTATNGGIKATAPR